MNAVSKKLSKRKITWIVVREVAINVCIVTLPLVIVYNTMSLYFF